jgi:hypothetical protein
MTGQTFLATVVRLLLSSDSYIELTIIVCDKKRKNVNFEENFSEGVEESKSTKDIREKC